MKFRVIFLKKKMIYYVGFILLVLIFILVLAFSRSSTTTFTVSNNDKSIKADVTGDGKEDLLYIKVDKEKYFVQVNTKDTSLYLEPSKNLNTMGSYSINWPMRLSLMDISRDKVPEIFIQSSSKNTPVQQVFMWNGTKFENVFSGSNNILGFLDCHNNKTPKLVTGSLNNGKIDFSNYILVNKSLQNFSFNAKENFIGKDIIASFISYIETLPQGEETKPTNIFFPGLSGKDIAVIGRLSGENCHYSFQDALFMDIDWDKGGEVSQVQWTLGFKCISNVKKEEMKNYSMKIVMKPDLSSENKTFKIYSILLE